MTNASQRTTDERPRGHQLPRRQTAEVVRDILADLSRDGLIALDDAVVVERDQTGKVNLEQAVRPARERAGHGALWGGAIGRENGPEAVNPDGVDLGSDGRQRAAGVSQESSR